MTEITMIRFILIHTILVHIILIHAIMIHTNIIHRITFKLSRIFLVIIPRYVYVRHEYVYTIVFVQLFF